MAKIYLIRHAESFANTQGVYQGQTYDTDLSELGIIQAEAMCHNLKDKKISRIISSPLRRTMQTARPLADELGLDIVVEPMLLETEHGNWSGKNIDVIKKKYPEEWKAWLKTPSNVQMPGGEHTSKTVDRCRRIVDMMKLFKKDVAIFTHGNIIQFVIGIIENKSLDINLKVGSAAYYLLDNGDGKLAILKRNYTGHLINIKSDMTKQAW